MSKIESHLDKKITLIEFLTSVSAVVSLVLLLAFLEQIRLNANREVIDIVLGYILGGYTALGFAVIVRLYNAFKDGRLLDSIDRNKWTRPFSLASIVVVIILGALAFYAEKNYGSGIIFYVGVAAGGALVEYGIGRALKRGV